MGVQHIIGWVEACRACEKWNRFSPSGRFAGTRERWSL